MPRKPRPTPTPVERAIDLTNLPYGEVEVAARIWGVPPDARFVVYGNSETGTRQVRLVWMIPPVPLPEPKVKRADDLQVGDKIQHPQSGEWLVIFGFPTDGSFDPYASPVATGLVRWRALNNRLQQVILTFLAAHEVAVYEEIR